jgi:quercetin dioxygenase-like cupin family protein
MSTPLIRLPSEAPSLHIAGQDARILLSAADTGGTHTLIELTVPPRDGPPPHIHTNEDETFIVLEGVLDFTIDGQTRRVGPGACIFGPRGVPHTFKCLGSCRARLLVLTTPGGFERFGAAIAQQFPKGTRVDPARLTSIMQEFGLKIAS